MGCLKTALKSFASQRILDDGYAYSASGIYKCREGRKLIDYKQYVEQLPFSEQPEVFGMHHNANIVYQTEETHFYITTRLTSNEGGSTTANIDELALDMIAQILRLLAKNINVNNILPSLIELCRYQRSTGAFTHGLDARS